MRNMISLILSFVFITSLLFSCGESKGLDEKSLGLRKTTILNEKTTTTPGAKFIAANPGQSKKFPRAFENAPPMIPHAVENLLPIKADRNMCLGCHMPAAAKAMGATPIPKSHLYDLRKGVDLAGKLDQARHECVLCHVPQSNAKPVVVNKFKPEFRTKDGNSSSNLLETLNEGVK